MHIGVPDSQLAAALIELAFNRPPMPRFLPRLSGLAADILSGRGSVNQRYANKSPVPTREALLSAAVDPIVNGGPD